jgi:hypothetical protein
VNTSTTILAAALFVVAGVPSALFAQTSAPIGVSVGQRVRVQAPLVFPGKQKGVVLSPVLDTLFLKEKNAIVRPVPVEAIAVLETSRGRQRWLWGFLGATTGFFAGGLLGAQTYDTGESDIDGILAATAGAVIGTISGAIVGAIAAPERWRRIPLR